MNIPNDADGDAMRRVLDDGSDSSLPMDIDFMISCPTVEAAKAIAPLVDSSGYTAKISQDKESGDITCCCMKSMLLDYDLLIKAQSDLDQLARPHGGYIDGWGTFGNGPEKQ